MHMRLFLRGLFNPATLSEASLILLRGSILKITDGDLPLYIADSLLLV